VSHVHTMIGRTKIKWNDGVQRVVVDVDVGDWNFEDSTLSV
jgi:hypothetical protein